MSNIRDYKKESNNSVKRKDKFYKFILIIIYLAIWLLSLIVFWFFTGESDAFGFGFIFLWILIPFTSFVISIVIGKNNYWGEYKWLASLFFGLMYMLGEYTTFSAANMVAFNKINMPDFAMIPKGAIFSAVGLAIGSGLNYINRLEKSSRESMK